MKQTISRLALLALLLSVSFGSTAALAQYRHHHRAYTPRYSHYRTGDAVIRGIHTAETVAHGAMMGIKPTTTQAFVWATMALHFD